jgi:beta-lactamase regulating signal transducer with metallopeptidase domain
MAPSLDILSVLWSASIAVIPLAIGVAVLGSLLRCRPATKHALWLGVLVSMTAPLVLHLAGVRNPTGAIGSAYRQVKSHVDGAISTVRIAALTPGPGATEPFEEVEADLPAGAGAHDDAQPARPSIDPIITEPFPWIATGSTERRGATPAEPGPPTVQRNFSRLSDRPKTGAKPAAERTAFGQTTHESASRSARSISSDSTLTGSHDKREQQAINALQMQGGLTGAGRELESRPTAPAGGAAGESSSEPAVVTTPTTARLEAWFAGVTTRLREGAGAWATSFGEIRATIANLPPIPPLLWIGGVLAVVVGWLLRSARSRHLLRHAEGAPAELIALVERESARIGLRRAPEVVIVDARISPSVVCDFRPRLAIPKDLWGQFDESSKRAAIVHELAHLRRRDHWVMWLEAIVGAIYWWHPVVWWIRKRIRDEADLCCDAWVTALMPRQRRAYAEALVLTKAYLSCPGPKSTRVGIGMASAHAKRFARRVTMVMTKRSAPTMSVWGLTLAAGFAIASSIAAPSLACPPEEKEGKTKVTAEAIPAVPGVPARALRATGVESRAGVPGAVRAPSSRGVGAAGATPRATTGAGVRGVPGVGSTFEQHMTQPGARQAAPSGDRLDQIERRLDALEHRINRLIELLEGRGGAGSSSTPAPDAGPQGERLFVLPEGKLEELTALMVRPDVPILVSPREGGLLVYGSANELEAFDRFVALIHPEHAHAEHAGAEHEHAVVADEAVRHEHEAHMQRRAQVEQQRKQSQMQYETQMEAMRVQAMQYRQAAEATRRQTNDLDRQMERMQNRAEQLWGKAEELQSKAEALREEADELSSESDSEKTASKVAGLLAKADEYEARAQATESEAEALESESERLEEAIEQVNDEADEIDELADEADEEADDLAEALEDELESFEEELAELDESDA